MKKKARKTSANKQTKFSRFKSAVEERLGKINWAKVRAATVALLLVVSAIGLLGPKAQSIAVIIIKTQLFA